MSSLETRSALTTFLATSYSGVPFHDADGDVTDDSLEGVDQGVLLQFIGNANESRGMGGNCFRELGAVSFHFFARANKDPSVPRDAILEMAKEVTRILMNKRVGSVVFEEMSPPNFSVGAAIEFKKGFIGAVSTITYYRDFNNI